MADLTVTAANVRELDAVRNDRITLLASVAVTRGQPLYEIASSTNKGKAGIARANAVGTSKVAGIATHDAAAGDPVEMLIRGRMVGWDLSSANADLTIYLSTTAGALADEAAVGTGNVVVPLGRIFTMTDVSKTPYIYFDIPMNMTTPVAL